ncbi:hypothetical protein DFJ58DRAFT_21114 [Suillus subalutaceus]|uniref:uncharacterized protein n=1 Tax=Suillus subalutaceus TaxID=48586 RepID=UPI001B876C7D|nr:uncharacterized protein DFJ58DRAFT_21114 [Suillus subalutaceus]KAG1870671.1 hypothetical protein DFJ58DRAFT_21114 [Suillus subalutaceus]
MKKHQAGEQRALEARLERLEAEQEAQKETMARWQAANEVFQALGEIGWSQISGERKYDLANTKGIHNFTELYYNKASDTTTMDAYQSVNAQIRGFVDAAIALNREVKGDRGHVAHPNVTVTRLQDVLDRLRIKGPLRDRLIFDVYTEAYLISVDSVV